MKAVIFESFGGPLMIAQVADPVAEEDGVVIKVEACGICRSDWHGWMGHDSDITRLPHVSGHKLAGVVEETGRRWAGSAPVRRAAFPLPTTNILLKCCRS